MGTQLGHQLAEAAVGNQTGRGRQGRRVGGGHRLLPRRLQFGVAVRLLQQAEMRGERGLEREAAEQGLAKGVDRADPHAAGQVQHPAEQRPGPLDDFVRRGDPPQLQFLDQGVAVERHPFAEDPLQPQRHLRRCRLGEGEAQDALRLGPLQHQSQQPVDQQLGLARPGGGRDEGGHLWVGRLALPGGGTGRGLPGGKGDDVHSPSSSAAHSATRANWV